MVNDVESYWVVVSVSLHAALEVTGGGLAIGYYRQFGIRSSAANLREAILAETRDGVIDWDEVDMFPMTPSQAPEPIRPYIVMDQSVWYRSGRMFFWGTS